VIGGLVGVVAAMMMVENPGDISAIMQVLSEQTDVFFLDKHHRSNYRLCIGLLMGDPSSSS
jgi:Holliday junction resolvasome RuvABC ATP-dependent DNA helicase subunit